MTSPKKQRQIENRRAVPERGARGNKRGKEAQARRAKLRQDDPRYQRAMAERDDAQRRIRAMGDGTQIGQYAGMTARILAALHEPQVRTRIAIAPPLRDPSIPPTREQVQASLAPAPLPPIDVPAIDAKAEGPDWTLGQARSMLRQGYRIDAVIRRTGWGPDWFDDMPLDSGGYGLGVDSLGAKVRFDWKAAMSA